MSQFKKSGPIDFRELQRYFGDIDSIQIDDLFKSTNPRDLVPHQSPSGHSFINNAPLNPNIDFHNIGSSLQFDDFYGCYNQEYTGNMLLTEVTEHHDTATVGWNGLIYKAPPDGRNTATYRIKDGSSEIYLQELRYNNKESIYQSWTLMLTLHHRSGLNSYQIQIGGGNGVGPFVFTINAGVNHYGIIKVPGEKIQKLQELKALLESKMPLPIVIRFLSDVQQNVEVFGHYLPDTTDTANRSGKHGFLGAVGGALNSDGYIKGTYLEFKIVEFYAVWLESSDVYQLKIKFDKPPTRQVKIADGGPTPQRFWTIHSKDYTNPPTLDIEFTLDVPKSELTETQRSSNVVTFSSTILNPDKIGVVGDDHPDVGEFYAYSGFTLILPKYLFYENQTFCHIKEFVIDSSSGTPKLSMVLSGVNCPPRFDLDWYGNVFHFTTTQYTQERTYSVTNASTAVPKLKQLMDEAINRGDGVQGDATLVFLWSGTLMNKRFGAGRVINDLKATSNGGLCTVRFDGGD